MNKPNVERPLTNRILVTPSSFARSHYLYVQEVGSLKSIEPHISRREKLESYLFFVILEGEGDVTYNNQVYHLSAGDCVWLDCRKPYSHESSADNPWSLMWVHFYGVQAQNFYSTYIEREGPNIYTPSSLSTYTETLQALYHLQSSKDAMSDLLCHKHLTDLITQIYIDIFEKKNLPSIPKKFLDIQAYLAEHYTEKISLDSLSKDFFISKFHLSREYLRFFDTTILNDLTLIRLSHAKSFLRFSSNSVEEIAFSCGFQTSTYFIKVFKKYENMTPLEYRRKW